MLKTDYQKIISEKIVKIQPKRNVFSLPKLTKVVINYRVTDARESAESLASAETEIQAITGQKAQLCRAKKSISTFKL